MDLPNRALLNRPYTALKRLVDIVLSLLGLVVLLVLGPLVALAILIDSGRPIFYTQWRTGLHGRTFRLLKFRTMRRDAEKGDEARWAVPGDERITRVGRFLRRGRPPALPPPVAIFKTDQTLAGPPPRRPPPPPELAKEIPPSPTRPEDEP